MQSTYTPGNLTTVMPGGGFPVSGGDDGFMQMAKLLFQRRLAQADKVKQQPQKSAPQPAPQMTSPNALGGGGGAAGYGFDPMRQMQQRMMQLELLKAEEAARALPEKNFQSLNLGFAAKVPDWSQVSLGNLPKSGGISDSPETSALRSIGVRMADMNRQKAAEQHMDEREQRGKQRQAGVPVTYGY